MTIPDPNAPKDIRSGPIRHAALPDEKLEQIRQIYEVIGPYLGTTLEQFEIYSMRDAHPEDEIAIWTSILAAWSDYHKQYLNEELLPDAEEKKLLAALIAISTGVTAVSEVGVTEDVGRKLLACYDALGPAE